MSTELAALDHLAADQELTVTDELQKAWHLFSILLSLGRPAQPLELASLCTQFAASPDLVQDLCCIPFSPIYIANDLVVPFSFPSITASIQLPPDFNVAAPQQTICKTYARKRKRNQFQLEFSPLLKRHLDLDLGDGHGNGSRICLFGRVQDASHKVYFPFEEKDISSSDTRRSNYRDEVSKMVLMPPLLGNGTRQSGFEWSYSKDEIIMKMPSIVLQAIHESKCQQGSCTIEEIPGTLSPVKSVRTMESQADPAPNISLRPLEDSVLYEEPNEKERDPLEKENINASFPLVNQNSGLSADMSYLTAGENKTIAKRREELFKGYVRSTGEARGPSVIFNASQQYMPSKTESNKKNERKRITVHQSTSVDCSPPHKPVPESASKQWKTMQRDKVSSRMRAYCESLEPREVDVVLKEKGKLKKSQKIDNIAQKLKQKTVEGQEKTGHATSGTPEDQVETMPFPDFESYVIEEEEGSGGYGTVYRARRKKDGTRVAIKCPHANARRHHVVNEQRMLERFGGKNFIIKYEGCLKSGDSDCFVLEHVEHDRPEVLKKEIDVVQLQWYGFCLFKALASLHKQGIVHRDVKPGNFLFSRKSNKGYLIDFNLAMDLHQKLGAKSKPKSGPDTTPDPFVGSKPPSATKKTQNVRSMSTANKREEAKPSRENLDQKSLKRKMRNGCNDLVGWSAMRSQGADGGSGITSTKETKTTSADRAREPLPQHGRKELISLVQKSYINQEVSSNVPRSPMRKRVAAPPAKGDGSLTIITPMPLHKVGGSVLGAGLRTIKGDNKKEGPCAGTKGFRAPEVLLRSPHQGPKLDMWSAGVTLLYLATGKMPFFGDPEQNMKDISKIKGSEELWEVAKLHNRESSFPTELYDPRHLPSMKLHDWCLKMTKRSDFLEKIPNSFFDLLEKCLAVNPRQRISAEEAIRHEFFTPCHDFLRKKQKLLQRRDEYYCTQQAAGSINRE